MLSAWHCQQCATFYVPNHEYDKFPYKEALSVIGKSGKVITHNGMFCKQYSVEGCNNKNSKFFKLNCVGYCECDKFSK